MLYIERSNKWLNSEHIDDMTKEELRAISEDIKELEDRFYKDLDFGTAGLRGVIGAGTNRMNFYTVGLATQGLANYISKWGQRGKEKGVVIAYDSRNMSYEFAERTALILCANGVKTYLFDSLRPVPVLSFAIKELECMAGIVITASHNPPQYNGYKVYWEEGYQLTPNTADEISNEIKNIMDFQFINVIEKEEAIKNGLLKIIGKDIDFLFNSAVIKQCRNLELIKKDGNDLTIVYSPLHGSGNIPVRMALQSAGFNNVYVVKEQEKPDGDFPTVKVPNPEDISVFELPIKLADDKNADIIFATDPDADRVGVAYKDSNDNYVNLTGNQIGCLLEYYLLNVMKDGNQLSERDIIIKSIVTSELATAIANKFNVDMENTLTGFKYIGEKIEEYKNTKRKNFIMGFEESYGYLVGDHARDKDAVVTSLLVCEMALYYKKLNKNLGNVLIDIYEEYGYYIENVVSVKMEGKEGSIKIQRITDFFRRDLPMQWNNTKVSVIEDFMSGKRSIVGEGLESIDLPRSNVIKVYLEDGSWFCVRPSGTEPKIKLYFSTKGISLEEAKEKEALLREEVMANVTRIENISYNK